MKSYVRNDIGDKNRRGLIAQGRNAETSANMPEISNFVVLSGDILAVGYSILVCSYGVLLRR